MKAKLYQLIECYFKKFDEIIKEDNELSRNSLNYKLFIILLCAILFGVLAFLVNIILMFFTDKGGVFGDFLGGVLNPIFTFLTLFGLVVTIVIQRRELKLAREEYEKTADALEMQAIEGTFFNIINLHNRIADSIQLDMDKIVSSNKNVSKAYKFNLERNFPVGSSEGKFYGRESFEAILNYLTSNNAKPNVIVEKYKVIQEKHNHIFGHYFRNLYQALKLIHSYSDSVLPQERKRKYASILRAQLSTMELTLLFINCLDGVSDKGEFKNLLIEYQMLEHLPVAQLEGGYGLSGLSFCIADDDMFLQYKQQKKLPIDLRKYFLGAFGENPNVPHNLKLLP